MKTAMKIKKRVLEHGDKKAMGDSYDQCIYHMHVWKYHDETPTIVQFMCGSK
jgi:hypothetical protein